MHMVANMVTHDACEHAHVNVRVHVCVHTCCSLRQVVMILKHKGDKCLLVARDQIS